MIKKVLLALCLLSCGLPPAARHPVLAWNDAPWSTGTVQRAAATSGLCSARPGATGSGSLFLCTDAPLGYLDTGLNTWMQFGTGLQGASSAPGLVSNWTVVGKAGLFQVGDSIQAISQDGAFDMGLRAISSPASAWIVETDWISTADWGGTRFGTVGACVTNGLVSGTSTGYCIDHYDSTNGWLSENVTVGTTTRAGTSSVDGTFMGALASTPFRARLYSDTTNLFFQISGDGISWRALLAGGTPLALPAGLTQYGFVVGSEGTGVFANSSALIESSRQYSPKTLTITNVTATASSWTVTTSTAHGMITGDQCNLRGIAFSGTSNPNGIYNGDIVSRSPVVKFDTATSFDVGNGLGGGTFTYTSGGTVYVLSR